MKIIEALKKTKDLSRKADDIKLKIAQYHCDYDHESPTYADQKGQVSEWLQAHGDLVKEISNLRYRIMKSNIGTQVTIEVGGKQVTKSIAEWIFRKKDLAKMQESAWGSLTDKNMQPVGQVRKTTGENVTVTLRRYYDPKERDAKREEFRSEPSQIDGALEVVNAITDLVE